MSRYDKDVFEKRIHGKANLKVGTSGSSGFEEGGAGNAISASYFFGDGSGLTGISGGGGGISAVVDDTSPQLGGDLDLNTHDITGNGNITLISTDVGSTAGPTIDLYRNSASPSNADYIGEIDFQGESTSGATRSYAQLRGKIADPTNGSEDGTLEVWIRNNGSNKVTARFNENGLLLTEDMSLRFEGATNDAFETKLTVADPTADRTITLPDASGVVALVGGGGGSTYQFWDPMAPPSSANSLDDEFTGSLGAQWSTWNPGSVDLTASVDTNKLLLINNTINGGDSYAGIYMNAPTASSGDYDYSYWTKVSWFSEDPTDWPQLGLIAANDIQGSPTTAGFWSFVVVKESSVFRATSYIFNNYASYNTQNFEEIYQPSIYLRIRISYDSTGNQTTGYFDYSNNGIGWSTIITRTQSGHIPFIGLVSNNAQGSKPLWGVFDFFRVYSGSNFYSFPSGSYADRTLS